MSIQNNCNCVTPKIGLTLGNSTYCKICGNWVEVSKEVLESLIPKF